MANSVRKNTVKMIFEPGTKVPSYLDVLKFSMDILKLSAANIHSIYKDENGGQFFIKLIDEETFTTLITGSDEYYTFKFEDGTTAKVNVEQASRVFQYVRIFNLPPEIEDAVIQHVLGQYGTIRQHVRERFPSELKVNIFTGVRGVHMEVSKEIPAHLYIGHFRARIFYDGLKNKCFFCKAEGHVKQNCPKMAAIASGSGSSNQNSGSAPLGRPAKPILDRKDPIAPKLTLLNSEKNKEKQKIPISITTTATSARPSISTTTSTTVPSVSTNTTTATPSGSIVTSAAVPSVSTTTSVTASSINTNTTAAALSVSTTTTPSAPKVITVVTTTKQTEGTTTSSVNGPQPISTEVMDDEISELDRQTLLKRTKSSSPESSEEETVELAKNIGKKSVAPAGRRKGAVPVSKSKGKGKGKKKRTK